MRQEPERIHLIEETVRTLRSVPSLSLELDLWKAQNDFFSIDRKTCGSMKERAEKGDDEAKRWINAFHELESLLNVRLHDG